jgi:hypothetical protein
MLIITVAPYVTKITKYAYWYVNVLDVLQYAYSQDRKFQTALNGVDGYHIGLKAS